MNDHVEPEYPEAGGFQPDPISPAEGDGFLGRLSDLVTKPGRLMVNVGAAQVKIHPDGWTAATVDGWLSAHFERSIAITGDGPWILGGDVEAL